MADGNTKEAEQALAQKEAEVKELKEKLEKAEGRVENAQAKIHEWEGEVGETRKEQVENAKMMKLLGQELIDERAALKKAQKQLEEAHEALAGLKKERGPKPKEGHSDDDDIDEKTPEEIEKSLTPEEQKKLDEAWEKADKATRARLKGPQADSDFRKRFLIRAKKEARSDVESDLSTWRSTPAQPSKPSGDDDLDKLFKAKKKSAEYVPPGPGGGTPRPRPHGSPGQASRKADWMG